MVIKIVGMGWDRILGLSIVESKINGIQNDQMSI